MDYNTGRKKLVLPEYGRNIQKMVIHLKTIEDHDERNLMAKAVIQVMGNMNPHLRDVADFTHKLWDHLAIISDFELDIDSPYPTPAKEDLILEPIHIGYKKADDIRFKHYGKVLESMIKRSITYDEGEEKDYLIEVICTQMKKSYVMWNRENITDDQIFSDLLYLSKNQLKIPEGLKLKEARDLVQRKPVSTSSSGRGGSKGGSRSGSSSKKTQYKQYKQKRR